jgi:hypothetical protein
MLDNMWQQRHLPHIGTWSQLHRPVMLSMRVYSEQITVACISSYNGTYNTNEYYTYLEKSTCDANERR